MEIEEVMEIRELIDQVLSGDTEAYREVVVCYSPEVRSYLALRIADPHTVDDLVQDVMIAAYWNLKQFDAGSEFGPWIQGIAKNKFKEHLRRCKTHKEQVIRNSVPLIEYLDRAFSEESQNTDLLERLRSCLEKLPVASRELAVRRYMDKLSVQKIAGERSTTESAVSNALYRIKKQLKGCIGGPAFE